MQTHRRSPTKEATTVATTACLPQDVLGGILILLPGSDLRRLRRVCKEWRDIIADPTFIHAHMIHGPRGPPCLTHTIVFFPGFTYGNRQDPCHGRGFLFDEHWHLTAELTASVWDNLVGSCNGLLCFLEAGQGSIKVIEPFTGESLALPQPPEASGPRRNINASAYCFGYDATTRRYKIVHHGFVEDGARRAGEAIDDEELHVYTVGGRKGWTRLHVASAKYGQAHGDPVYVEGSVYWPTRGRREHRRGEKLVRFDLATEKMTLEPAVHQRLETPGPDSEHAIFCRLVDSTPPVMTYSRFCHCDAWFPEADERGAGKFPGGHVLLWNWDPDDEEGCSGDYGLFLCGMERSLAFGQRRLLFEVGKKTKQTPGYNRRGTSFVPARPRRQLPIAGASPTCAQYYARTFGYSPTASAAPLGLYLGTQNSP